MAELTNLESKLGEVGGLAMAAQEAGEKVAKLAREDGNDQLLGELERMREEAKETAQRGTEVAASFEGKKTAILDEARERARSSEVSGLVDWALPIQKRHLETVRTASLELASEEDPNETSS